MPLLPDDLRARLPRLYAQEADLDPIVYARFYLPGTQWAWYVIEGEPEDEDFLFFGFVMGLHNEFGYFRLSELEALRSPLEASVECDPDFPEGRLTDVVPAPDT